MTNKLLIKKVIMVALSLIFICVATGVAIFFTLRESREQSDPEIILVQQEVAVAVGETKMLHATLKLPDGTILDGGLVFTSSDTSVLQFSDENNGVFRILDVSDPPETVTVTISAPEYSVETQVTINVMKYSNKLLLDYNGANSSGEESIGAYYLHRINGLPSPQKTNYKFVGWFTEEGEQYENGDMFMGREDVRLIAKFSASLILDCENGQTVAVEGVEYNMPLPELTTPDKNGWRFEGWYTQRGGNGIAYAAGDVYLERTVTLFAKWVRSVKLDCWFFEEADELTVVYAAPVPEIADPDYSEYEGAIFSGWYTQRGGEGDALPSDGLYLFDDASVLYACVLSEVRFNAGIAENFTAPEHFYIPLGNTYGKLDSLPVPINSAWEFEGWYTEEYGNGDKITEQTQYSEFITQIVLNASWCSNISLSTEIGNSSTMRVTYGRAFAPAAPSSQYNWIFDGWYSERCCGGEKQEAIENYFGEGSRTLYAGWKKIINVNYNGQEHSGSPDSISVIYGLSLEEQNKALPTFIQTGLVQKWSITTTRSNDRTVTNNQPLPKEVSTLYLLWFLDGSGTENDPYTICNESGLNLFAESVNSTEKIYNTPGVVIKVTANISMSGEWSTPIANNNWEEYYSNTEEAKNRRFVATFDGGNKTISNLKVNVSETARKIDTYVGLFGYVGEGGVVRNVNLENVYIYGASVRSGDNSTKGGANNGGIAGLNSGTVSNCTVSGTVTGKAEYDTQIGGIVGYMFAVGALVKNCTNNATVSGTAGRCTSHGGILGSVNNGHIYNCTNNGSVEGVNQNRYHYNSSEGANGYQFYGGISGVCCAVIEKCVNNGTVQAGYVASFGNSGGAEIVGYLHDGSDKDISTNTNQSLYIDTASGIKYSNTYYYSGVIDCSSSNSSNKLLGFVQNDHNRIAVSQGYNSSTMAYVGSRAIEVSGNYSVMYMSVDTDTATQRALICSFVMMEEIADNSNGLSLPVWGIALACVGGVGLIGGLATVVVFVSKKRKNNKDKNI